MQSDDDDCLVVPQVLQSSPFKRVSLLFIFFFQLFSRPSTFNASYLSQRRPVEDRFNLEPWDPTLFLSFVLVLTCLLAFRREKERKEENEIGMVPNPTFIQREFG